MGEYEVWQTLVIFEDNAVAPVDLRLRDQFVGNLANRNAIIFAATTCLRCK